MHIDTPGVIHARGSTGGISFHCDSTLDGNIAIVRINSITYATICKRKRVIPCACDDKIYGIRITLCALNATIVA